MNKLLVILVIGLLCLASTVGQLAYTAVNMYYDTKHSQAIEVLFGKR